MTSQDISTNVNLLIRRTKQHSETLYARTVSIGVFALDQERGMARRKADKLELGFNIYADALYGGEPRSQAVVLTTVGDPVGGMGQSESRCGIPRDHGSVVYSRLRRGRGCRVDTTIHGRTRDIELHQSYPRRGRDNTTWARQPSRPTQLLYRAQLPLPPPASTGREVGHQDCH